MIYLRHNVFDIIEKKNGRYEENLESRRDR